MDETSVALLKKMMDGCVMRQTVLANNLANANTAGFTRSDLSFRGALAEALQSGGTPSLQAVQFTPEADRLSRARADGNNVVAQKELGQMAQNGLLFEVAAKALTAKYTRQLSAIKGQ